LRGFTAALLAAMMIGCGGDRPTMPTAIGETLEPRLHTEHFRILAGATPASELRAAADRLELEYARIVTGLGVDRLPEITVRVWQDPAAYFDVLTRHFGVRYEASGYITGPTELRMLAGPRLATTAVHEFVHAATLSLNPSFANNPRWLWETVALYENGEFVDPRTLPYLAGGAFPTLQQLNVDPNAGRQIYELGYLLGEYIISTYGRPGYLQLILSNGDLSVLGVSQSEFESGWRSFVRRRYLS
jgi:hypothetical protein